jgi:hypothetical protein
MAKMEAVKEELFGGLKGKTRHAPLEKKGIQDDSIVSDDMHVPLGTHRGLLKNKDIQDRLVAEYSVPDEAKVCCIVLYHYLHMKEE